MGVYRFFLKPSKVGFDHIFLIFCLSSGTLHPLGTLRSTRAILDPFKEAANKEEEKIEKETF